MEVNMNNFSKTIVELRKKRGITQEELAKKLFLTRQAVSRWEREGVVPDAYILKKLAKFFDTTVDSLLGSPDSKPVDANCICDFRSDRHFYHQEEHDMSETNRKLRIGVMGGRRGIVMMEVLANHPDAELVAICDYNTGILDARKQTAEKLGCDVAVFESFDEFIKYDMDAVILANYATEHATFAVKCMKAGKHVLSEVLPTETMAQAVELVECVEETGLVYAYAENYCYMQHTFEMWRRYKNGEIGDVMYGEGEYIHDCSGIWHDITYGDPTHWRNLMHPTFYCTHSLGPLITMTGLRPIKVVGYELNHPEEMRSLGLIGGSAGLEIVTLENGAVMKSVHGNLKREPSSLNYELYGTKGMMETGRLEPLQPLNVYKEGEKRCVGEWEHYAPEPIIAADIAKKFSGHGGSDLYPTHFFIEKILGREDGEWSIDVYQALDMGIPGLLALRSLLNGNIPYDIPNFRNKEEREPWRHDHACCTESVAGDQLLPASSYPLGNIPNDEVYARMKELCEKGENA